MNDLLTEADVRRRAYHQRKAAGRCPRCPAAVEAGTYCEDCKRKRRKNPDETPAQKPIQEPTRVITVRLPKSLRAAVKRRAHQHEMSANRFCILLLQQPLANGAAEEAKDGEPLPERCVPEEVAGGIDFGDDSKG